MAGGHKDVESTMRYLKPQRGSQSEGEQHVHVTSIELPNHVPSCTFVRL